MCSTLTVITRPRNTVSIRSASSGVCIAIVDAIMSTPASHLETLNLAQRKAVAFGAAASDGRFRAGPLLVIAGAGTGKTNTLAHRVAHLVLNGVDPSRVMLLTFTRRAAMEMR